MTPSKPAGAPVWIELLSADPDAAASFYEATLGVEVTEPKQEFGGYRDVLHDGQVVAGLIREKVKGVSCWRLWLRSDDIAATLAAVSAHGGEVLEGPEEVEGLGRRAVVRDPSGAETGVWELHGFPGIEVDNVPGGPCWYELRTTSRYAETVDFYREAFGWEIAVLSESGDFRMVTFGEEYAVAGIFDASSQPPEGGISRWQVYFRVEDVDATAAAVTANGGTVTGQPEDTPFGRMAYVADSTGAPFCVILPSEPPTTPDDARRRLQERRPCHRIPLTGAQSGNL